MISEVYLEPSRTSKMELFEKIFNDWKAVAIFAKSSILNFRVGPEYPSIYN